MLEQGIINAKLGRDTTTAVSQLQWSQSLKIFIKKKISVRLHMVIKNNNEDNRHIEISTKAIE